MRKKLFLEKILLSFLFLLLLNSCEKSINDNVQSDNNTYIVDSEIAGQIANVIDIDKYYRLTS